MKENAFSKTNIGGYKARNEGFSDYRRNKARGVKLQNWSLAILSNNSVTWAEHRLSFSLSLSHRLACAMRERDMESPHISFYTFCTDYCLLSTPGYCDSCQHISNDVSEIRNKYLNALHIIKALQYCWFHNANYSVCLTIITLLHCSGAFDYSSTNCGWINRKFQEYIFYKFQFES